MAEVLVAAKKNDALPAAVLPSLFSMAMRKHLKEDAKNKNVCCNVVIDCREPMQFETNAADHRRFGTGAGLLFRSSFWR